MLVYYLFVSCQRVLFLYFDDHRIEGGRGLWASCIMVFLLYIPLLSCAMLCVISFYVAYTY